MLVGHRVFSLRPIESADWGLAVCLNANCTAKEGFRHGLQIVVATQLNGSAKAFDVLLVLSGVLGSFKQERCQGASVANWKITEQVTWPQQKKIALLQLGLPFLINYSTF